MANMSERIKNITPFQLLVSFYFIAILISFLLLRIPAVYKDGKEVSIIDTLFTAVSAISVTGLTVFDISETFTNFGMIVLLIILQLGAIGVMSIGTFIWLLIGKRIGMRERQLIMIDFNQHHLAGVVRLLKEIVKILFIIEALGALILSVHFKRYFESWSEAFKHGIFASISATTNSGFDITGHSFEPFYSDYFVQFITMILIVLGAIGFPVLVELKHFLMKKNPAFRFSLFTKITTVTYGGLFILGTLVVLFIESFHSLKGISWHEKIFVAMFQSVSTRSAGLTTMDIGMFNEATNIFLSFLMFVGSSPSSVGGGIRTTTFAIAILFLINFANGRKEIQVFGREICMDDILRSFVVIILALFMVMISTMILVVTEPHGTATQIVFEITSAFGTCGMSLGLTEKLSTAGKLVIMTLMFIGRVGLISFLFTLGGKAQNPKYRYPEERIIIG
ncbi:TrkH family potassium uptake protein [Ureibacillus thermosphaericus]|jgi:Trk-type K+ transport system membrane component|uniref:Trk-type K+ transport system membrane component n=1 Tax=Ureibacillus thermosphaericus TaxID=51173 RepID=A0A840PYF8_URETH|nr:potassium transporter TrkG [Ureibacillus thermosphaericus]MBB5149258.1 Trk-type K+ transport system membrane component [Ureibacillus thermosphaericus]NKZ32075.1 TrkH family potassium uptake protein [Ureibacillus thermosphaericus]